MTAVRAWWMVLLMGLCTSLQADDWYSYLKAQQLKRAYTNQRLPEAQTHAMALRARAYRNGYYAHNLGQIYLYQQQIEPAIAEYQEALRFLPAEQTDNTRLNLAAAYSLQGNQQQAIATLKAILRRNPNHIKAKKNLEFLLAQQQEQEQQEQEQQQEQQEQEQEQQEQEQEQQGQQREEEESSTAAGEDTAASPQQSPSSAQDAQSKGEEQADTRMQDQQQLALEESKRQQEKQQRKERAYRALQAFESDENEARKRYQAVPQYREEQVEYDW